MGAITTRLTDGSGISGFTASKLVKDFVADFLLTAAAALAAAQIAAIPTDVQGAAVVSTAIGTAFVKAIYRALLKWTAS